MILDALSAYANVDANRTGLFGRSNGSALINRILIESDDPRIVRGVTEVSQLNEYQFRNGCFFVGGADNAYTKAKPKLVRREVLSLQGGNDPVIPAAGGASKIGFNVVPDAESIYALAVAFGHVGPPVRATRHSRYKAWSYLNGAVASITLDHAGHKVYGEDADVDRATVDFLARSSSLFAAQDPSSAAGSLVESDISMH